MTIIGKLRQAGVELTKDAVDFFLKGSIAYPQPKHDATVNAYTSAQTLTTAILNEIITNTGASGTLEHALPAVASSRGDTLRVQITAAQIVRLQPPSGTAVYLGGSATDDKYLQIAGVIGNYADLYCDGADWIVTAYSGVLTKEA